MNKITENIFIINEFPKEFNKTISGYSLDMSNNQKKRNRKFFVGQRNYNHVIFYSL